jgi:hypothetical protein
MTVQRIGFRYIGGGGGIVAARATMRRISPVPPKMTARRSPARIRSTNDR